MLLRTIEDLRRLLALHRCFANGKNSPAEPLHETVAESRWAYENLLAVYLTNPEHAWMAVWMAVTRRDRLKKRCLRYLRPAAGDEIGHVEIYNPDGLPASELFCETAHLYLFNAATFADSVRIDLTAQADKVSALMRAGFRRERVARRGWSREGFVPDSDETRLVAIDAWQVAAVNYGSLMPDLHAVIAEELIAQLAARVVMRATEVGEEYLA